MKKTTVLRGLLLSAVALAVAACGNLSDVSKEGTTDNPVFPDISKSKFNHDGSQFGSWPNWQNVRQVEAGMNKDELYNLLGRPHFSEGLYGVREWDYVFNYRENGVHKVCQFKILFDTNMNAQSFYWYPNGCNGNSTFNLSSDFLFDFDKATLTAEGIEVVDNVAAQLKASNAEVVTVAGYTDRLGSAKYNMNLSQRRAETVRARLVEQGVTAPIEAVGHGKAKQVKACSGESGNALKDCLRPNRRVEVRANGGVVPQSDVAGPNGPAPLYDTPHYNTNAK
ncbi:OmpA family protein [Glaesserella sp.]|uniref:OmpA family protein n=1 Tax=Glaesserella sp. TaxID=2094731 RepID=UPI00359F9CEF